MKLYFTDDIVQFLSGNDGSHAQLQSSSSSSEVIELSIRTPVQDDDSQLVQLDSSPPNSHSPSPSSSDTDLAMYDDPNSTFDLQAMPLMRNRASQPRPAVSQQGQHNRGRHCRCGLQAFLYHWLAVPIQKYRYAILGGFIIILGTTIGLDVQIRPSTKPPAFFKETTNLQQLLDLKYNMSSDKLNLNDMAWELVGSDIQANGIDTPTPTKKSKENNGLKTPASTPTQSPATAEQPGPHQKTNILQPKTSESKVTPATKTTTQQKKKTSTPTPSSKKTSTLE